MGVSHETLEKYTAVSKETAAEMAAGAARVSGADVAVSVTGIAGPDGGTKEQPVGLVYICLLYTSYRASCNGYQHVAFPEMKCACDEDSNSFRESVGSVEETYILQTIDNEHAEYG